MTQDAFRTAVAALGHALLRGLAGLEHVERHLHPAQRESGQEVLGSLDWMFPIETARVGG